VGAPGEQSPGATRPGTPDAVWTSVPVKIVVFFSVAIGTPSSWRITTRSVCTVRSATSRPRPSWPVATRRSSLSGTASWMPREKRGERRARRVGRRSDLRRVVARVVRRHYDGGRLGRRIGRRGDTTRAPSQGPRPKGGRHDAALSFPFGIGTKAANRCHLIKGVVYLISQHRFLHFTENHYTGSRTPSSTLIWEIPVENTPWHSKF